MSNTIKPELGTKYGIERMLYDSVTEYDASLKHMRHHNPTIYTASAHPGSPICPGCFSHTGKPHYPCCPLTQIKHESGPYSHYHLGPHGRPHFDPMRPDTRTMSLETLYASSVYAQAPAPTAPSMFQRRGSNSSFSGMSGQTDYGFSRESSVDQGPVHPRVASVSRHSSFTMGSSGDTGSSGCSGSSFMRTPSTPKRYIYPYKPPDPSYHTFTPKSFRSKK